jgi:hypothetical protein
MTSESPWVDGLLPLIHCGECNALYRNACEPCPVCGHQIDMSPRTIERDGVKHSVPAALAGALPYSSYVLLDQIRTELEHPVSDPNLASGRPAQHYVVIILLWTLFESLMERFFETAFADLPGKLGEELLRKFPNIGDRLGRLYKSRWGTTFWDDLATIGYAKAAEQLKLVQERRNSFVHGEPEAIDNDLVRTTVERLLDIQLGWVAVFNLRCTGLQRQVPLWHAEARKLRP